MCLQTNTALLTTGATVLAAQAPAEWLCWQVEVVKASDSGVLSLSSLYCIYIYIHMYTYTYMCISVQLLSKQGVYTCITFLHTYLPTYLPTYIHIYVHTDAYMLLYCRVSVFGSGVGLPSKVAEFRQPPQEDATKPPQTSNPKPVKKLPRKMTQLSEESVEEE